MPPKRFSIIKQAKSNIQYDDDDEKSTQQQTPRPQSTYGTQEASNGYSTKQTSARLSRQHEDEYVLAYGYADRCVQIF
jgi:hypothetical protein